MRLTIAVNSKVEKFSKFLTFAYILKIGLRAQSRISALCVHAEKSSLKLVILNLILIVITLNRLVPNRLENGKYNSIMVKSLCVHIAQLHI